MNIKELELLFISFPGGTVIKNPPAMQETREMWVQSLDQEDPLKEEMATHFSILAWKIPHDHRARHYWVTEHTQLLFIMMDQGIKGRQGENEGKKNIIENFLKSIGVGGLEKPRC